MTVDEPTRTSTDQLREVVTTAEGHDEPGVMGRRGQRYAEPPDPIKTLGAGARRVVLARMKNQVLKLHRSAQSLGRSLTCRSAT